MSEDEFIKATGGPAYPLAVPLTFQHIYTGATLLDYFAIHAGEQDVTDCAPQTRETAANYLGIDINGYDSISDYPKVIAKVRYTLAEAMLAERARRMK